MAATWQATGTLLGSTGADITPVNPAHQADDILICLAASRVVTDTCLTPSGWTLGTGSPFNTTAWRVYWFWKRATSGAETNPLLDWTGTGEKYGQVHSVRGADTTGDFFTASAVLGDVTDPITGPTVSTTAAGQRILVLGIASDNLSTTVVVTGTDPATYTLHHYSDIATGADAAGWAASNTRSAAGASGSIVSDFDAAMPAGGVVAIALEDPAAVNNRAEVSFAELEVPSPNNRAEVSWAELEVPIIPAPEAWFMGDAGTGSAVNNDPVPTWSDQSGIGNDASQATGTYQPIYKTNVQNGLPVLDFQDHSYTIPGILDALNGAGGASVFAVWKSRDFVSPVAAEVFYMSTATGTSSRFTLEQRSQADGNQHNLVVRRLDGDAATHLNGPPNQTGMPFIISSAVVDLPGNTAKLYRGGAEVASAAPSVGSTFTATNSARAAIGSFDPAGAPPTRTLDGQIGELIFYPRALTTAERQRVETYLVDKWATAVNNRAEVSWAEFEVPSPNNRAEVSWAEMEIPSPDNRAEVSWTELEVPDVGIINNRAEVSWAELEVPTPDNRAEVSWAEVEVPDVAIPDNRAEVSWAEMEVPSPNNRAEVSWAEFEVPDFGAAIPGTPQEWAVWYLDTYDHCNVLQHRHYPVTHELEPNMPPGWVRP